MRENINRCVYGAYRSSGAINAVEYCSKLFQLLETTSQLRTALAAEQQHSAQLQERIGTLNRENLSINAALVQAQERATKAENELKAHEAQCYIGMSEHEVKESMREYLGFNRATGADDLDPFRVVSGNTKKKRTKRNDRTNPERRTNRSGSVSSS